MKRVALGALLLLTLAACGKKGPPVSPERRVPQPVGELAATVLEGAIELGWTNPTERADGTRLRDLARARVFRSEDAGTGEPRLALLSRGRVAGYAEALVIRLDDPPQAGARVEGGRVRVSDRGGLVVGRRYTYVVVTEDARGHVSPPSERLSVTYIVAPGAPGALRGEAGEREARLAWTPVDRLADGGPATGELRYEVLRADTPEGPLAPVTPEPVREASFVDRGLDNDRTYHYAVRAVRREAGSTALGATSPRVAVTPADRTPPSPPSELVAIPSPRTVRLTWRPSPEPDVASYVVHRASGDGPPVPVGTVLAPGIAYVDRDLAPGRYRYAVSARDRAVAPNESARSVEVQVAVP